MRLPNKEYFLKEIPNFELSYDEIIHKKVYSNNIRILPKGLKSFLYFTNYNNINLCIVFILNKYNLVTDYYINKISCDKKLCYGTVILGILCNYNKYRTFTCLDIIKYQGNTIEDTNNKEKLDLLYNILDKQINQKPINEEFIICMLPIYTSSIKEAFKICKDIKYDVQYIQLMDTNLNKIGSLLYKNNKVNEVIFKVKARIEQDIYELHCQGKKYPEFYNYAYIPEYKTSVLMNSIFRRIKENSNLDLLEMSEDEDDFENIQQDKFVNLKKIVYMKCIYNKKFKKWQPIEVVNYGEKLLLKNEILNLEK